MHPMHAIRTAPTLQAPVSTPRSAAVRCVPHTVALGARVVLALAAALALALALALASARNAAGQTSSSLRVAVFAGSTSPQGALPNAPILREAGMVVSYGGIGTLSTLGIALEAHHGSLPLTWRVSAAHGLAREETGQWGCAPDRDGEPVFCPSVLILVPTDVSATRLTADAGLDVGIGDVLVRPLVGIGWLRYAFHWDPDGSGTFSLATGKAVDHSLALTYGVALAVPTGRVRLEAEVRRMRAPSDPLRPSRASALSVGVSMPIR